MFDPSCRVDVALRTHRDFYVTALNSATGWYLAGVSQRILGWENFTLLRLSSDEVALKTAHNTYVTAFPEGDDWFLRARADRILGWEIFKIHYLKGGSPFTGATGELPVALRTSHGRWVRSLGVERAFRLIGDADELTPECHLMVKVL